jgi:hypothetical protein
LGTSGRMYAGPAILGIKQISRQSEFGSSYTLIEHASEEALQFELKLWALERIKAMRKAWDEGDYQALFEVIGKSEVTTMEDGVGFDPDSLEREDDPASEGCDPAEAVLLADRSGNAIKIPYVFNQLNRKLARWAFRACTSADLKLPSFALADDGVLIEHRGKILSASDWIPEDSSITSLAAEKGCASGIQYGCRRIFYPFVISPTQSLFRRSNRRLEQPTLTNRRSSIFLIGTFAWRERTSFIRRPRAETAATSTSTPSA